jgi:hypothetical protein
MQNSHIHQDLLVATRLKWKKMNSMDHLTENPCAQSAFMDFSFLLLALFFWNLRVSEALEPEGNWNKSQREAQLYTNRHII